LLLADSIVKQYAAPGGALRVLNGLSLSMRRGEAASIMGPSGSGKTTLLSILGALEPPTSGSLALDNENPYQMNEAAQAAFRNRKVGFVFQDHSLLPQCTVLENVLIPSLVGPPEAGVEDRARALLAQVGLTGRLDHLPSQLSGGEKQRVAIARALIRKPLLLLCDEPTGNLDARSSETVAEMLFEMHRAQETILIVVTHSAKLAERAPVRYELSEGVLARR
jgi:lipoprotein-releasing system ATP-binding protein